MWQTLILYGQLDTCQVSVWEQQCSFPGLPPHPPPLTPVPSPPPPPAPCPPPHPPTPSPPPPFPPKEANSPNPSPPPPPPPPRNPPPPPPLTPPAPPVQPLLELIQSERTSRGRSYKAIPGLDTKHVDKEKMKRSDSELSDEDLKTKKKVNALADVLRQAATVGGDKDVDMNSLMTTMVEDFSTAAGTEVRATTMTAETRTAILSSVVNVAAAVSERVATVRSGLTGATESPKMRVSGNVATTLAMALGVTQLSDGVTIVPEGATVVPYTPDGGALIPFDPATAPAITIKTGGEDCVLEPDGAGGSQLQCGRDAPRPVVPNTPIEVGSTLFVFRTSGSRRRRLRGRSLASVVVSWIFNLDGRSGSTINADSGDTLEVDWDHGQHNLWRADGACPDDLPAFDSLNSVNIQHPDTAVTRWFITPPSPGTYCFACKTHYDNMHFTYVLAAGSGHVVTANANGATSYGDPHLNFAEGGQADFRGRNDTWYALFSAPGLQFAAKTIDTDFLLPRGGERKRPLLVHGSFFVEGAWTIFAKGRLLGVSVDARNVGFTVFDGNKGETVADSEKVWTAWRGYGVEVALRQSTLYVNAGGWQINATRKPVYDWIAGASKWRLDLGVRPFKQKQKISCFPHGLLGQSFDFDGVARDGKMDTYDTNTNEYTTSAMAEGAIEGSARQYELFHKHYTNFAYTRFRKSIDDECAAAPVPAANTRVGNGVLEARSTDPLVR